jgi:hypothetical protein
LRDVAEHNAMFSNPEGVMKIRESRENSFHTSDEEFKDLVKQTFGRDVPNFDKDSKNIVKEVNKNIDTYLNMDLDEVKFVPYDED